MAKTKKQNSVQISAGGYTLSPTYSTTYPSNITLTGATGTAYTTGTSASTWATNITLDPYYTKKPKVEITDTDLVIDGQSLKDFMRSVQKELSIPGRLNRNKVLEAEFAELEAAAEQYHKLEEKFLEQKAMWETLKKTDQ
jgi:hypothetical protein